MSNKFVHNLNLVTNNVTGNDLYILVYTSVLSCHK